MKPYYHSDGITIYHGDCREIMTSIEADVLVTDPPYGMDAPLNSGGKRGRITPPELRVIPEWDRTLAVRDAVLTVWLPRPALVFASITQPPPGGIPQPPAGLGQRGSGRYG